MSFDPTKPVQTRDGRKARIVCADVKGSAPIIAAVEREGGGEIAVQYDLSGGARGVFSASWDLVNIPAKCSRWHKIGVGVISPEGLSDRAHASETMRFTALAYLEIIFEDGRPVEAKLHEGDA